MNKIISAILMFPIIIGLASACSCISLENTEAKLNNAAYVFSGSVESIKLSNSYSNQEMQEVMIRTIQYWKPSEFPESVNLKIYSTKDTGANCGYNFENGKTYIIYAYLDEETNRLTTNSCMGNTIIIEETNEIRELNTLTNSTPINEGYEKKPEPIESNIFTRFFSWFNDLFS